MEELRMFAVSSIHRPPVEFSRKKDKQMFTCTLTLPIPPQLLIFNQGDWPEGEEDEVTLDIFLDSEKIGEMTDETKCFAWEAESLESRPAGDKIFIEIKVRGLKPPTAQGQAPKSNRAAVLKKLGRKLPSLPQKETTQKKQEPLHDISEKLNADLQKMSMDSTEKPRDSSVAKGDSPKESTPGPEKAKPAKRKSTPPGVQDKKKSSPPFTSMKKTRQTQLNFSGPVKSASVTAEVQENPRQKGKVKRRSSPPKSDSDVEMETNQPEPEKDAMQTSTVDVEEKNQRDAQVVNESTPQEMETLMQIADMPSPLPRKPVKAKRPRSDDDKTPEGPTPKKRGTRMRALASEGTPKSARSMATLGESPFKENAMVPEGKDTAVQLGDGRMTSCTDLSGRAPWPSARWGHTMLLTEPRCAVLIGGQGDRQQLSKDSVWTLHTETRRWRCQEIQSEGQKPENRMGHTATYDPSMRCVYIFGGSKNSRWYHDVHMYDLDENKWTLAKVNGKAPTRAYHTATLHRHELWVFGGVYPRPDPNPDGCSNDIHIFSPVMQSWYSPIVQGEKPLPRSGHSATLIDDKMVMFGGWDAPYCYNDLFILDMTTVDWSKPDVKGTPPKPRSWHASCALSKRRILIHGGYDGNDALEDSFLFDLDALSWSRLVVPCAPKARAGHAAVCLPYSHENKEEDEVLVFGGGDNDGEFFHDLLSFSIPFNAVVEIQ